MLARVIVRDTSVVEGFGIIRLEPDSLIVVFDGALVLTFVMMRNATVFERVWKIRV